MRAKNTMGGAIVALFLITLLPLHTALAGVTEYINKGLSWAKGTGSKVITNYTTPAYKYITTSRPANFIAGTAAGAYNNYGRPALNNYVKPILSSGINIVFGQPASAAVSKPMNQSLIDNISNVTVDGKNYTGIVLDRTGKHSSMNSTENEQFNKRIANALTDVQNNGTKITINTGIQTGRINSPEVGENNNTNLTIPRQKDTRRTLTSTDLAKALGVNVSVPSTVSPVGVNSSVVASTDLNATNPASLIDQTNLMGAYLNNGRRKSDPTVYNPKYDTQIQHENNLSLNEINPASLKSKNGVLYHNDGTQYGFRSIRNPDYDMRTYPNNLVAAEPIDLKNQINPKSLNSPTGPYYNDGTRYRDRSIKNPAYDIQRINPSVITSQ